MKKANAEDVELALRACDMADALTMTAFSRSDLHVETKPDDTPVTEADRAVEQAVWAMLRAERPEDRLLGEEFGHQVGAQGSSSDGVRRWILDPIDGTANFVRHYPIWATLLALEVDGELVVGAVSAPALGRRWWAGRGLGAFAISPGNVAATRLEASRVSELSDSYVLSTSVNYWHEAGRSLDGYLRLALGARWDRGIGDFWSHMMVAEGCAEVGVDPYGKLWDFAALQVVVEEAGGCFTDLAGVRRADGGSALSTNGLLHETALAMLAGADQAR